MKTYILVIEGRKSFTARTLNGLFFEKKGLENVIKRTERYGMTTVLADLNFCSEMVDYDIKHCTFMLRLYYKLLYNNISNNNLKAALRNVARKYKRDRQRACKH